MKKYQIFIDTEKQETFYEETSRAKYINPFLSENKDLVELITKGKENYYNVYRNYKQVKIFFLNCVQEDCLEKDIVFLKENQSFFNLVSREVLNSKENKDTFFIIEVIHPELLKIQKKLSVSLITPFEKLLFIQDISRLNQTKVNNTLRYRLLLDDRLLVERFFPESLREDKSLVEEVYLDIQTNRTLRLITNEDLYVVKVSTGDRVFYPNSTEFILEP
jgi:hypothetical protein